MRGGGGEGGGAKGGEEGKGGGGGEGDFQGFFFMSKENFIRLSFKIKLAHFMAI